MRLYLLRHGTAEERASGGYDSPDRQLTSKGRRQARAVAAMLEHMGTRFDRALSSPFARAHATAREVLMTLNAATELVTDERLVPGARIEDALTAIFASDAQQLLVVGHEPLLSELAAKLIGDGSARIDLKKAGLIELEVLAVKPPRAELLGLIRPRYLQQD